MTKIPDVSRLGYTFQWRLDYLTRIDPAVRAATVARISRQLNDPATTYALQKLEPFYGTNWPRDQQQLPLIGCLGGLCFREVKHSNLLSATEPFRD